MIKKNFNKFDENNDELHEDLSLYSLVVNWWQRKVSFVLSANGFEFLIQLI